MATPGYPPAGPASGGLTGSYPDPNVGSIAASLVGNVIQASNLATSSGTIVISGSNITISTGAGSIQLIGNSGGGAAFSLNGLRCLKIRFSISIRDGGNKISCRRLRRTSISLMATLSIPRQPQGRKRRRLFGLSTTPTLPSIYR